MRKFSKDRDVISKLPREQYRVTQQNGTEIAGTGEYLHNKEPGIYVDVVSGRAAVRVVGQVRLGLRLAELHQAHRPGQRQRNPGHDARHGPHRGALGARRQPSRPRLSRRSEGTAADCATASTQPRCGSFIATICRPRGMRPTRIRRRMANDQGTRCSCRRLLLGRAGPHSPPRRRSVDPGRVHRRHHPQRNLSQSWRTRRSGRDHL